MPEFIFNLTNRGTFSELNNLILAHSYSKRMGGTFKIDDRSWSGSAEKGLNDYFEIDPTLLWNKGPKLESLFFNFANGLGPLRNRLNKLIFLPKKNYHKFYNKMFHKNILFTNDFFFRYNFLKYTPYVSEEGKIKFPFEYLNESNDFLLKYNNSTQKRIMADSEKVKSHLGGKFVGLHLRKGDKVNLEMGDIPLSIYKSVLVKTGIKNVFVATDSYIAFEKLRDLMPKEFNLVTFSDVMTEGWVESEFRARKGEERKTEMLRLFSDVEILIKSNQFIGTYSSCLSQYIGLRRKNLNCLSLDNSWILA